MRKNGNCILVCYSRFFVLMQSLEFLSTQSPEAEVAVSPRLSGNQFCTLPRRRAAYWEVNHCGFIKGVIHVLDLIFGKRAATRGSPLLLPFGKLAAFSLLQSPLAKKAC